MKHAAVGQKIPALYLQLNYLFIPFRLPAPRCPRGKPTVMTVRLEQLSKPKQTHPDFQNKRQVRAAGPLKLQLNLGRSTFPYVSFIKHLKLLSKKKVSKTNNLQQRSLVTVTDPWVEETISCFILKLCCTLPVSDCPP